MRVSLFWRPVVICLALVAAILVAVQWTSPDTLGKVWPLLLIFLAAAGIAIFLSFRSVDLRIRRLKQSTERAAAGDFTPFERDHSHDELADLTLSNWSAVIVRNCHTRIRQYPSDRQSAARRP